jgi:hypothetical protein
MLSNLIFQKSLFKTLIILSYTKQKMRKKLGVILKVFGVAS